jgi:hypothetical protein
MGKGKGANLRQPMDTMHMDEIDLVFRGLLVKDPASIEK